MAGIPAKYESEIVAKAAEHWTSRHIADWLLSEHGVKTSHITVCHLLRRANAERASIAKSVLREKLRSSLTTDLDRLEKHAQQLDALADRSYAGADADGGEREVYAKLVEQIRKITDTKLHYSGADQPDELPTTERDYAELIREKFGSDSSFEGVPSNGQAH